MKYSKNVSKKFKRNLNKKILETQRILEIEINLINLFKYGASPFVNSWFPAQLMLIPHEALKRMSNSLFSIIDVNGNGELTIDKIIAYPAMKPLKTYIDEYPISNLQKITLNDFLGLFEFLYYRFFEAQQRLPRSSTSLGPKPDS